MNDEQRLKEIEARLNAATSGPWKHISIEETNATYHFVVRDYDGPEDCVADVEDPLDADLISATPTDLHYLVSRVLAAESKAKALEAENKLLRKMMEEPN